MTRTTPDDTTPVVVQVAIVVRDLDATIRAYQVALGWDSWRVYDFRELPHRDTAVRGTPTAYAMRTALARVGGLDFEIIEPLGPSPYQEFLDTRGEGLHHIQVRSSAPDDMRARLDSSGMPVLMGGQVDIDEDSALEYVYHDGTDLLHLIVESTYGDRERLLTLPSTVVGNA